MATTDPEQPPENLGDSAATVADDGGLVIRSLNSHVVRAPRYVVRDWRGLGVFPIGGSIVAGKQGSGKSTFLRKILSDFTSGTGAFRGEQVGSVLYCAWEDDPGSSILPEFAVNGGDPGRVHFLTGVRQGALRRQWQMDDLERIENYCAANPEIKVIVIDTLTSLSNTIGRNTRGAKAAGMITTALHQLGLRLEISVVIVCHLTKLKRRGGALDAIAGSTELTSGPRAVWMVGRHPDNPDHRAMVLVKHNLSGLAQGCTFRTETLDLSSALESLTRRGLRTEGELPESMFIRTEVLTDEEVPTAEAVYTASTNIGEESRIPALDRAVDFIRQLLADNGNRISSARFQAEATATGISAATVLRARNFLRENGEIQTFQTGREHFVATADFDRLAFIASRRSEPEPSQRSRVDFGQSGENEGLPQLPPSGQYGRHIDF